ncbi:MAG: hypothetical protein K9W43_03495 [Candidatus Thorarchaeota archaeon]|nr:hypothetical protein [Candidatus Thorarchaeota archaeon]
MSGSERSQPSTPSTIEAIRLASLSVLGLTTRRGYPLGTVAGSGSMMQQNSDEVAMNVAPLTFAVRDALYTSEDLEILSMEWELEHASGIGLVPEQLLIAGGGIAGGVGSHVSVLGWERGMIDPFRMDDYVKRVSKKIADIELAVNANGLEYETQGLEVLRKFCDRLNNVLYVDLLDRRFQRSWDSIQIRKEHTEPQVVVRLECRDDFTTTPPGIKIIRQTSRDFLLPTGSEDEIVAKFKHRVLTPLGVETLAMKIPRLGQAVLSELNSYAYAIEEEDIARTAIKFLTEFIGADEVAPAQVQNLRGKAAEFTKIMGRVIQAIRNATDSHLRSGMTLDLAGHHAEFKRSLMGNDLNEFETSFAESLIDNLVRSLERRFPTDTEFRAWQMRSSVTHFLPYCERVASYFADELRQYLLVNSARKAFLAALHEFRAESITPDTDEVSLVLFEKFYSELYAQLNAIFDRKAYQRSGQESFEEIVSIIAREMIEVFGQIDMWDLIEFTDVANIARSEIKRKYEQEGSLTPHGTTLMEMLDSLETLVAEIVPDIAQTLLSRGFITQVIDRVVAGSNLMTELYSAVENTPEKPEEWREEARRWLKIFEVGTDTSTPLSKKLLSFQEVVHERAGTVVSAGSVVVRVSFEAEVRQNDFDQQVKAWEEECARIETENAPIIERNRMREELSQRARSDYAVDYVKYKAKMHEYQEKKSQLEASGSPTDSLYEPTPPEPLEARLERIAKDYPKGVVKPLPPKPEPSEELLNYTELRDLLTERITSMDESQEDMERVFSERLRQMEAEASSMTEQIHVSLGDEFLDYLLASVIRSLGRLFPQPTRTYLRNPDDSSRIYLVTYEREGDELTVTIGDTILR